MDEKFCVKSDFMEQMTAAIDGRIAVFHFSGENNYISEKLFDMLGFDAGQRDHYVRNTGEFISFLESRSVESNHGNSEASHLIGIVDTDEKYIIIHLFKGDGECFGFVIDKTSQVRKNTAIFEEFQRLRRNSQTDGLTGLLNRAGFEETVRRSLELQPGKGVLCIFDMDNFKLVNDTLGHPTGDKVLKKFAEMLNENFAKSAFTGRIGGDEFVVFIYDEMTHEELSDCLAKFGERIKTDLAEEYPDKHLSTSIGAVTVSTGVNDYAALYKSADLALYKTKQSGKGSYNIV